MYYQVISAPPGYVIGVTFSVINTESCCDPMYVFNSLAGPFRTSSVAAGAAVYTCAGTTGTCATGVRYAGLYGTPVVVEQFTDSSVVYSGLAFVATLTPCPAGSYCSTGAAGPTTCPIGNYCPTRSFLPTACDPSVGEYQDEKG